MAFVRNMPDGVGVAWIFDLSFPVGPGCRNHRADVQLVQHGINTLLLPMRICGDDGQPIRTYLKRDGLYGTHTAEAMWGFQQALANSGHYVKVDGRFDPSSPTGWTNAGDAQYSIVYLNRNHRDVYGVMMKEEDFPEPLRSDVKANRQVG